MDEIFLPANIQNDTKLSIDNEKKKKFDSLISESLTALHFVKESVKEDSCLVSIRFNGFAIALRKIQEARFLIGGKDDIKDQEDAESKNIKKYHQKIANLEKKLSEGVSIESIECKLKTLQSNIETFWGSLGFNSFLRDSSFSVFGSVMFNANLSGLISDNDCYFGICSEDSEHSLEYLENQKQFLNQIEVVSINGMKHIADSVENRNLIFQKLSSQFPGISVNSFVSKNSQYGFYIDSIEIRMHISKMEKK